MLGIGKNHYKALVTLATLASILIVNAITIGTGGHIALARHHDTTKVFKNGDTNIQTDTNQGQTCETASGTSPISGSCTANSNDNIRSGIISPAQSPVRCPTALTLLLTTLPPSSPPMVGIHGNLTNTCTGQGVPGATITFTRVSGDVPSLPPVVTGPPPFGIYEEFFTSFPGASGTLRAHFAGNAQFEPSTATQSFTLP
jgi:hypothetical protein